MIFPRTIKYYQRVTSKNSKGQVVNAFPVVSSRFQASVKPMSLTDAQAAGWSATDLAANSKFMAYPVGVTIRELDRIVDAFGNYLEIRGVNPWTVFPQALLVPVQGEATPVAVDGVSVQPNVISFASNLSSPVQLVATLDPVSPTNPAISWATSDALVATVSSGGLVTPVGAGECVITVTTIDGGFTAPCNVEVAA